MAEDDSRTEAATPTRLTKAQADGDGSISREVVSFAALTAAAAMFAAFVPSMTAHLVRAFIALFFAAATVDSTATIARSLEALFVAASFVVTPFALCVSAAAVAATFLQSGGRLNRRAIGFHFAKLNPISGVSNLLSMRHTVMSAQSVIKISCIAIALYVVVNRHIDVLLAQMSLPTATLPKTIERSLVMMLEAGVLSQGLIAAADFFWSKRQFSTRTQMSQTEIKDEQKEIDGDPAVKAKLKMLRAKQAKRNLRAAMAKATVVVTNPTHYAVALEYHEGQARAPRVIVKGVDHLATRIREMAIELRVPMVPNPPLARALYTLDEDAEITPEHYKAVAEIIAYVWKLAQRQVSAAQL